MRAAVPGGKYDVARHPSSSAPADFAAEPACPASQPCPAAIQGEGLLHDARNLMGALGLYCDLLSMPDVLKPEHNHYPEELRQLGVRSQALIERLMESLLAQRHANGVCMAAVASPGGGDCSRVDTLSGPWPSGDPGDTVKPVSLRSLVERCSGLLSGVAEGTAIEVGYGVAAAVPVRVSDEAVERILVNLVRNASAALRKRAERGDPAIAADEEAEQTRWEGVFNSVRERIVDGTEDETPGAIRIGVGLLVNRVGDPKPWPFRRVRLIVEDSGCGMDGAQLERLLCGGRAPSRESHGIGFRVVRELVAASGGDLRVMSQPGIGTRVQIEWPVAAVSATDTVERVEEPGKGLSPDCTEGCSAESRSEAAQTRLCSAGKPSGCACAPRTRREGDSNITPERWGSC